MEQLTLVFTIALMFVIRLGIPVLTLLAIGILIDRIQSGREKHLPQAIQGPPVPR